MTGRGNEDNLRRIYDQSQPWERIEGSLYYNRQRKQLERRANGTHALNKVAAAFAALSPNNAESTNYRALDTCLEIVAGRLPEEAPTPHLVQSSVDIRVGGCHVRMPSWLPRKGWSIHSKGYVIYTSRSLSSGIRRGARMHRLVVERIIGRALTEDEQVHHQDFNKTNNCYCNLILLPSLFNPSCALRDPYTGEFLSLEQWRRRYGNVRTGDDFAPDWVTREFEPYDEDFTE